MSCRLFLFDLDGTLVDTAPDLVRATNLVRTVRGLSALPEAELRPFASKGAPGLIGKAFGIDKTHPGFPALRDEFLANYRNSIAECSRPFDGILPMLDVLKTCGVKTGVLTNKYEELALSLLNGLGLRDRFDLVLGSNSPGCAMKPAPDSFITALRLTGLTADEVLYAGDDRRDIEAAHLAGIQAAGVYWGYLSDDPETWEADYLATHPSELTEWALAMANNQV